MAADMKAFLTHYNTSKSKEVVAKSLRKHNLTDLSPQMSLPPEMLEATDGIGVYFNPEEGREMMMGFDTGEIASREKLRSGISSIRL